MGTEDRRQTLAVALREARERERERAEHNENMYVEEREDRSMQRARREEAEAHLRAVLYHYAPAGTTGHRSVREARAWLEGKAQPSTPACAFCSGALEDQSIQGVADRIDEAQRLRAEFDKASAHLGALSAMLALYGLPSEPKALAAAIERERNASEEAARELELASDEARTMNDLHTVAAREREDARAELEAERKAHAETRGRLGVEREKRRMAIASEKGFMAERDAARAEFSALRAHVEALAKERDEAGDALKRAHADLRAEDEMHAHTKAELARLQVAVRGLVAMVPSKGGA